MYATVRRYEGTDRVRSEEITRKVTDSLIPTLEDLPGFVGYSLIDVGAGGLISVSVFETSNQAHESTRVAANWIHEHDLASALPNTPEISAGPVIAQANAGASVGV